MNESIQSINQYKINKMFFRLPGEAMQIDRVMDAFAAHYCRQNPYLFEVFHIFTISH